MKRLPIMMMFVGLVLTCTGCVRGNAGEPDIWSPPYRQVPLPPISATLQEHNTDSKLGNLLAQDLTPDSRTTGEKATGRASGQPAVTVQEIQATRSNFSSRLEIRLQVSGKEFERASEFRCRLAKAVDDTGADLIRVEENSPDSVMFSPMPWVQLKLPTRKALVLKELSGVVEVLCVDRDPKATIIVAGFVGKPQLDVSHPSLTASGARLTIVSNAEFDRIQRRQQEAMQKQVDGQNVDPAPGNLVLPFGAARASNDNRVVIFRDDPNHRIVSVEFLSRSGDPIPNGPNEAGVLFSQKGVSRSYAAYNFDGKLPETTVMRIVVATPKAVATVPFSLKNVPLP